MKKAFEIINAIIVFGMLLVIVASIVFRVILRLPASWSEELAQYSFIFLVFIGSAALMKDNEHIKITVVIDRINQTAQKGLRIINGILMLVFLVIFSIGSWNNAVMNWTVSLPIASWMKMGYMYLVLFLSGVMMIVYIFLSLYHNLAGRKQPAPSAKGDAA